jgi:hypothetical protein
MSHRSWSTIETHYGYFELRDTCYLRQMGASTVPRRRRARVLGQPMRGLINTVAAGLARG